MYTYFHAAKGGQGCSTTAAAYALQLDGRVLIADMSPQEDLDAVLGIPRVDYGDTVAVSEHLDYTRGTPGDGSGYDHVVVDWGTRALPTDRGYPEERWVRVTRACYLALRAAIPELTEDLVFIAEPGRALRSEDVECALRPTGTMVTLDLDPHIARAVDAGLLHTRTIPSHRHLGRLTPCATS